MNRLPILIRREFWEHRSAFLVVPTVITLFLTVMMLVVFTASTSGFIDMTVDLDDHDRERVHEQIESDNLVAYLLDELDHMSERRRVEYVNKGLQSLSFPLVTVLWVVVFFYLLSCLYDDRRDRSILFWKSMPVSDTATVLAKLVTALVVVPVVYLGGIAVLQIVALLLMTMGTIGTEISAWEMLWAPASVIGNWMTYLGAVIFYSLWALPFFGWLLTVSSFARSVPFAWAVGVPLGLTISERIFTNQSQVADWMSNHIIPVRFISQEHFSFSDILYQVLSLQMLSAILVGGALVLTAIWLRGRADEI